MRSLGCRADKANVFVGMDPLLFHFALAAYFVATGLALAYLILPGRHGGS